MIAYRFMNGGRSICVIIPCTLNTISSGSATSVVDVMNFQHFGCSLYVGLKRSICVWLCERLSLQVLVRMRTFVIFAS